MKDIHAMKSVWLSIVTFLMTVAYSILLPAAASAAACQLPSTDYGTVTTTLSVPSTATYRMWSRIMAPDSANNTYLLEIDGVSCYTVGGGAVPAGTWTWVDYQAGNTASKINVSLSQGNHTLKLIGSQPNVKLDRVEALSDLTCVPTGTGDNCNAPTDTTTPTVSLTAPVASATVSGNVALSATASDNVGVTKVEFYDNSLLVGTDTTSPYGVTWDTTQVPNGAHLLTAKAYDAANNIGTASASISVMNGDAQAPTTPGSVSATANAYNKVTVSWTASTDNIGVTSYAIVRNGTPLTQVGAVTSYVDTTVAPSTSYSYQVKAMDAAGNQSVLSSPATATTPNVPDTQAPTSPTGLTATAVSSSQINLSWQASTDNIGVTGYDVYRVTATGATTKVATVTTPSFGDTGLQAGTQYSYYVRALDATGNVSTPSVTVNATTQAQQAQTAITGVVRDAQTGKAIYRARVVVWIGGSKIVYRTAADGSYTIKLPSGGRYNVTYAKIGYQSQSFSLNVLNGTVLIQNVSLNKK